MDDNLFDENDALDYVMYEECEKEVKKKGVYALVHKLAGK